MDYLKLNVIRPTNVLGSKPKREEEWCKYEPTIVVLHQPGKYGIKTMTEMYIHHNMDHVYQKKIQEIK